MSGYLLDNGATVMCAHSGQAQATMPSQRVKAGGQPIVTQSCTYTISGCPFVVSGVPVPCVTGQWITAATRVMSGNLPVLLMDSQSVCTPNGTPMTVVVTQMRAKGT
jgi:hypothetical protein